MTEKGICLLTLLFLLCSCSKDNEQVLYFIGDSMIANWDVEASFPNYITKNLGKDGSQASYLGIVCIPDMESEVVVLIGTNDLYSNMSDTELTGYCEDYRNYLSQMDGKKILVVSVLPTSNNDKNNVIRKFNIEMAKRLKPYTHVMFVDCYSAFLDGKGKIREDLSRDGIHLNDYGYILLEDHIKPFL